MDPRTARDYLEIGIRRLNAGERQWDRRDDYYRGKQDLPYAPDGVNEEYLELREMALANWLSIAMDAPIQRLRVDGFRTGRDAEADDGTWRNVWQANRLDARQRIVYSQMMVHGRGIMSVWPNEANPAQPIVRPENSKRVHLEPDPEDPFTPLFAVKRWTVVDSRLGSLGVFAQPGARTIAVVHEGSTGDWVRFERGGNLFTGDWVQTDQGESPIGEQPFVAYDHKQDADGMPHSAIEPLMSHQDAINTIRFNTLLAMQFSAFRQRVFTGYDPVVRDERGQVVRQKNADGTIRLDKQGQPMPVLNSPGRVGVDRALVFPGIDTKVFDLPESNLKNYIEVLGEFLTQLFATGQIPPQYLLSRMANLSGDALAGAESTLASLVSDLQTSTGESHEELMRKANKARGEGSTDLASETIWGDGEARSFAQTVDAITKLVSVEFPREAAFEMIPGATQTKVQRWMSLRDSELANDPALAQAARLLDGSSGAAGGQ